MLKCDDFIGCIGSCDEMINTKITADFSGEFYVLSEFNEIARKTSEIAAEGEEIEISNNYTPNMLHRVSLVKLDGTKIKNISFKVKQCL